jgi:hypothetical protein
MRKFLFLTFVMAMVMAAPAALAQYCGFTANCIYGDEINDFWTTGGTNNISNMSSGCSTNGYGDFTSMVLTVVQGQTFDINVQTSGAYSQGFAIWIDWNQNESWYDTGEFVWDSGTSGTGLYTGTITVPAAAPTGTTRMRVMCGYVCVPDDPCFTCSSFGEAEDYTVEVLPSGGATNDLTMLTPGGPGSGSVTPDVGVHSYPENTNATITASPDAASTFDYWEVDGVFYSSNATDTIFMDNDYDVQAFFAEATGCVHSVALVDDFGDGWNGGLLTVEVNGVPVLTDITLATGSGPEFYTFLADTGDTIQTFYTPGSWSYENEYYIYDGNGIEIGSDGVGGTTPTGITVTGDCDITGDGEYAPVCIRVVDPVTGENADTQLATETSEYEVWVTVLRTAGPDTGFTVTVTDPSLPGWSATASGTAFPCSEVQVLPNWTGPGVICGNHQLIADIDGATIEKSIEVPDLTGEVILKETVWPETPGISNAFYVFNYDSIIATQITTVAPADLNYVMIGLLNSLNNSYGVEWPDGTNDQFALSIMRDDGTGQPQLPPEVYEGNLYPHHSAAGPLDVLPVYWVPQCSISFDAGESFWIGFQNLDNCASPGEEGVCLDNSGSGNYWYYDADLGTWDSGDPFGYGAQPIMMASLTPTGAYISLDPAVSNESGLENVTVTHSFTLLNETGDVETIDLAISGETWVTTITSPNPVVLNSGDSAPVTVTVQIPPGAFPPDSDSAILTATAQTSGLVATSTLNTSADDPEIVCTDPNTMFGQNFYLDNASFSDEGVWDWMAADDFTGLTGPITSIEWWGIEVTSGIVDCTKAHTDFEITFYDDNGGIPGAVVHQEVVTATRDATSILFGDGWLDSPVNKYRADLATPVALTDGWVSILGLDDGADCGFAWCGAEFVSGYISQSYNIPGDYWQAGSNDLAFCLIGEVGVPAPTNCQALPDIICAGDDVELTADSAFDIYWYDDMCGGNLVGTGSPLMVNPMVDTTYYARAYDSVEDEWSDNCCDVMVIVNPIPACNISGPPNIQEGDTETYAVPEQLGATYLWTVSPEGVIVGPDDGFEVVVEAVGLEGELITIEVDVDLDGCICTNSRDIQIGDYVPPPIPATGPFGIGLLLLALGGLMKFAKRK